ncbi:5'-methylthioadenosine/S-adenosylhomocysteine nucleosidase [Candidatus Woesearchaeota archaeon]|nr:5'-methylthioadenosine/S-adenosylhomocysteine nucleosidase [Candidatus Woesearchaeota archaeon]
MNSKDILIVCALEIETQEELNDFEPFSDDPVWEVLYTGVGKVNATGQLTERLHRSHLHYLPEMPKLVINYGTAGSRKIKKGQLVDCTKFIQRDMDVTGLGFMRGQTPFEDNIPIILDYDHVEFNPIGRRATCGSGDNFVEDRTNYYGEVVDMEAYALAKVCYHYNVPFISFKYITDGADEQAHEDWEKNLADGIIEFKERVLDELES